MKNSYDFGKPDQITQDVAQLYQSIYEAKKKVDQDKDGDNDFADVQIAKMIASGMSKEEAIRRTRNKSYNEEAELEEAAARVPRKVRGYKDAEGYMAGRSDAGKRISGDEKSGPGAYTSRMYAKDKPVQPGSKPNTPKVTKSELNYARTSYNSNKGKTWNKFGGAKGIPGSTQEDFEIWVNELLDEGYDLSEFTVDEIYEIYEETELEKKKRLEHERNERRARVAELTASGRVMTSSKRTSAKVRQRAAEKRADELEKAAQKVINATTGSSGRVSEKPMGSEPPTSKVPAPVANRRLPTGLRKDNLGRAADLALRDVRAGKKSPLESAADEILKKIHKEDFELWVNELLDEGYDLSDYTWDELGELYEESDSTVKGKASTKRIPVSKMEPAAAEKHIADTLRANRRRLFQNLHQNVKEDYDAYDLVIGYLLDEGFVDDYDAANTMIKNMSDEWLDEILESKYWIQGAIKKPGALHKQLGVPMGEKIPSKKLTAAAKKGGKEGQRARLAKTLRKFH
jgi:hypothetical protein